MHEPPLLLKLRFLSKIFNAFNLIYAFFKIYFFAKKNKSSIIHFFLPTSYLIGGYASFLAGHKKMIMSRRSLNLYQKRQNFVLNFLEKQLFSKTKIILGNSTQIIHQLSEEEGISKEKLKLIYNGIQYKNYTNKPDSNLKKQLSIGKKTITLVKVANLIGYKGHIDLINSLLDIKYLDWKLLLIGSNVDDTFDILKKIIQINKISEKILFIGPVENVQDYLSISDIGILTSHEEGFSNSILEYMSASLPVIATNVGGNSEVVMHNKNGYLVNKKNINSITNSLKKLILNKDRRRNFGKYSRYIIEKNFSLEKTISKYRYIYDKVLSD